MLTTRNSGLEMIHQWIDGTVEFKIISGRAAPALKESRFFCADHLIRELGKAYEGKPCPSELIGEIQQCYFNCLNIIRIGRDQRGDDNDRYTYIEGYGMHADGFIPTMHAWLLDNQDGLVIDPTWPWSPDHAYFGVAMPFRTVAAAALRNGMTGVFEADWAGDFYFLRKGWDDCGSA